MGGMGAGGQMMAGRAAAPATPGEPLARLSLQPAQRAASAHGARASLAEAQLEAESRSAEAKVRQIGSKTFYFKGDRWIDSTVKPEEDAKAKRIRQFSEEFFKLARSQSAELNQYLTFTESVTLKLGEEVYRVDPAEPTR
jgi:hypothetical protein